MFNVLVVDDEPFVRFALKSLCNWEIQGFRFAYEASNGKEALDLVSEKNDIDILIVDMNMPVMHGLDLIERIRITNEYLPIIVLSAYNDYNFVRRAFKLGIADYILKIEMNAERILELLLDASKRIVTQHRDQYPGEENSKIRKEAFLRDLINIDELDSRQEAVCRELSINLDFERLRICCFWIDDFHKVKEKYKDNALGSFAHSITCAMSQVISGRQCGEVLPLSPQEYVLFLSPNEPHNLKNKTINLLNEMKHTLKNYLNIEVSIGVSNTFSRGGKMKSLYQEAKRCAQYRLIAGKNKIIFYDDLNRIIESQNKHISVNTENLGLLLKNHDYETAKEEFFTLLNLLMTFKPESIDKIYDYYLRLIFIVINHLTEIDEEIVDIFDKDISFYEEIAKLETLDEINTWVSDVASRIFLYLGEKRKTFYSRSVVKALKFIKANFKNNELTMKTVSDYVELSSAHFSHLFTKETGENFIDYLIKMRINEAKRLLQDTNLKVYEICFEIGYDNVEHFSRMFKKITGASPHNFKKI